MTAPNKDEARRMQVASALGIAGHPTPHWHDILERIETLKAPRKFTPAVYDAEIVAALANPDDDVGEAAPNGVHEMSDLPRVLTGPPSLLPPCGAVNVETGAHCELANGHAQNHRGAFADGIAQWPLAAPAPTQPANMTIEQATKVLQRVASYLRVSQDYPRWAAEVMEIIPLLASPAPTGAPADIALTLIHRFVQWRDDQGSRAELEPIYAEMRALLAAWHPAAPAPHECQLCHRDARLLVELNGAMPGKTIRCPEGRGVCPLFGA